MSTLFLLLALATADPPARFPASAVGDQGVFRGTYSPSGEEFLFFRQTGDDTEQYGLFVTRREGGRWSPMEPLFGAGQHGRHSDMYPAVSPDGNLLVFSSYRPMPGVTAIGRERAENAGLWWCLRKGDGWSEPAPLRPLSTPENYDSAPRFSPDGSLVFDSTTPDWTTTQTLRAEWNGDHFASPTAWDPLAEAKAALAPQRHVWSGILDPTGKRLVLEVSERDADGRPGPADLWFTTLEEGTWQAPRPVAPGINTLETENFVHFSPDGSRVGFVREFREIWEVDATVFFGPDDTLTRVMDLHPGHPAVDASRLRPIRKTIRGLRKRANGSFEVTGLWTTRLRRDGGRLILTTFSSGNGFPLRRWEIVVDAHTLEPIDYEYRELTAGDAHEATFVRRTFADGVQRVTEHVRGKVTAERSLPIDEPAFDANLYSTLFLAFPLHEGFRGRYPALHAEDRAVRWRDYEVLERTEIPVGLAGKKEPAWIVRQGPYRYWITTAPPYVLRMEAPGPNGTVVASEVLEWSVE